MVLRDGRELMLADRGDNNDEGDELASKITGNYASRHLVGNSANETVTGNGCVSELGGDTGADSMVGGVGDEIYDVDDSGDKIAETSATGGRDWVNGGVSIALRR